MIPAIWRRVRLVLGGLAVLWGGIVNLFLLGNWRWASPTAFVLLNQIAPWITLFSLLAFSLAFTLRARRWLVLWLAPGIIAFVWWYAPAWLPKAPAHVKGVEFTAVTYNVLGHLADPEQTFAVIRDTDADLVALEELRPLLQAKLRNELSSRYPYQVSKVVQGYDGLALLSRFPILESEISLEFNVEHINLDTPRYLRAVVDVQGRPVAVYVIHIRLPRLFMPGTCTASRCITMTRIYRLTSPRRSKRSALRRSRSCCCATATAHRAAASTGCWTVFWTRHLAREAGGWG